MDKRHSCPPPFEFPRELGREDVPALIGRYRESLATFRTVPGPKSDPVGWVERLCSEPILAGPHPSMALSHAAARIVGDVIMLNGLWFAFQTIAGTAERVSLRLFPRCWIWSLIFRRGEHVMRRVYASDLWPGAYGPQARLIGRLARASPLAYFIVGSHVLPPHCFPDWPPGLPQRVLPVPTRLIEP